MDNNGLNKENIGNPQPAPQQRELGPEEKRLAEFVRAAREARNADSDDQGAKPVVPASSQLEIGQTAATPPPSAAARPATFQTITAAPAKPAAPATPGMRPAIQPQAGVLTSSGQSSPEVQRPSAFQSQATSNQAPSAPAETKPAAAQQVIGQAAGIQAPPETPKPVAIQTPAASATAPATTPTPAPAAAAPQAGNTVASTPVASEKAVGESVLPKTDEIKAVTNKPEVKSSEALSANVSASENDMPTSIIADGTVIIGKIKTEGNLKVMGIVEGNIDAIGSVLVRGKVTGNIKGAQLDLISCQVKGMLTATSDVSIDSESTVLGDVEAESVVFDGKLKGNIKAGEKITLNSNSYLVGDITSKTITIGTGAVVNGQIKTTGNDDSGDIFDKVWPASTAKKAVTAERKSESKADVKSAAKNDVKAEGKTEAENQTSE